MAHLLYIFYTSWPVLLLFQFCFAALSVLFRNPFSLIPQSIVSYSVAHPTVAMLNFILPALSNS